MEKLDQATTVETRCAKVVLDVHVPLVLDYMIPQDLTLQIGNRVEVPLRNKTVKGVVVDIQNKADFDQPLEILSVIDPDLILPKDLLELAQWMSHYYATNLSKVFQVILPHYVKKAIKTKYTTFIERGLSKKKLIDLCSEIRAKFPKRAQVIDVMLKHTGSIALDNLLEQSGVSVSVVDALVKNKALIKHKVSSFPEALSSASFLHSLPSPLTPEQQNAYDQLSSDIEKKLFQVHLLFGITGSGKTRVYLEAIEKTLSQGHTAILLVPEIALTSQIFEQIQSRFPNQVVWLHHKLSSGKRHDFWKKLYQGEAKIVVGPRSALFSPLPNLGLIIIDEEHDSSFKQSEEMPCYQARDVAIMRAKINSCPIILGSATPSRESFYNAQQKKYNLLRLTKRATKAKLPQVHIVNMKLEGPAIFSRKFLSLLKEELNKGHQAMILLNRRGYRAYQKCSQCEEVTTCVHCSRAMTYHKRDQMLLCHLCGYSLSPVPQSCKACGSKSVKFMGFGTQFVESSLRAQLPEIQTLRLDRDTTSKTGSLEHILDQFKAKKAHVLVGTQMIAKGFDIPNVTLALVLNCDLSLNLPDFRSAEKTFALVVQMAGRSGRGDHPGHVVLQTYLPSHPTIHLAANQDYESFFTQEADSRKMLSFPPFKRLLRIVIKERKEESSQQLAMQIFSEIKDKIPQGDEMFPPIPSGYAQVNNWWRHHILIKTTNTKTLNQIIKNAPTYKAKRKFFLLDIDPSNSFF